MNELKKQIKKIQPSVKESLFMYLFENREFKFLTKNKSVIGFELDFDNNPLLDGFVFLAFKKQTIIVYKSDMGEDLKLVIFPTEAVLMSDDFDMSDLNVTKTMYSDCSFVGKPIKKGKFGEFTKELIANKDDDIILPEFDKLDKNILEKELSTEFYNKEYVKSDDKVVITEKLDTPVKNNDLKTENNTVVKNEIDLNTLPLDKKLLELYKNSEFKEPTDVMNYCIVNHKTNKTTLINLLNFLLANPQYPALKKEEAILFYIKLINKSFNEGRI